MPDFAKYACLLALPLLLGAMPPVPHILLPPIPAAEPDAPPDDAAATAERIAKNAKALGDKLASNDTGADTLSGQEKLKKDIDSLIKAMENPPPMGGGGGSPPPMGGSPPPPMGGGSSKPMGGSQKPMGSGSGRKPRGGSQQPMGGQPGKPMGGEKPVPGGEKPMPGKPGAAGSQPGGGGMATPALPLDEAIARDFWGNLPDLPRQRMMQFFREQYMSRYKELLPQYYQSLAEKEKKGKK